MVLLVVALTWINCSFDNSIVEMGKLAIVFVCITFNALPILIIATNKLIREWIRRKLRHFVTARWPFARGSFFGEM